MIIPVSIKNQPPIPDYAFSFNKRYVPGYSGPLFRVRRLSDSTQKDIYVFNNTYDVTAYNNFISGTSGVATRLYNQRNNGQYYENVTAGQQPPLLVRNGKFCANMGATGVENLTITGMPTSFNSFTIFNHYNKPVLNRAGVFYLGSPANTGFEPYSVGDGESIHLNAIYAYGTSTLPLVVNTWYNFTWQWSGGNVSNSLLYRNGNRIPSSFTFGSDAGVSIAANWTLGQGFTVNSHYFKDLVVFRNQLLNRQQSQQIEYSML